MTEAISSFKITYPGEAELPTHLASNHYVVLSGENFSVPPELEDAKTKLTSAFTRMKRSKCNDGEFTARFVDTGEFYVSEERVTPFKGRHKYMRGDAYAFINSELYENPFLHKLLQFTIRALPTHHQNGCYVEVMLARHEKSVGALFIHQDNVGDYEAPVTSQWVVQYNIERSASGIEGGDIQIYDPDMQLLEERILTKPLDGYIVHDDVLFHSAKAITIQPGSLASRNIIVIRVLRNPEPLTQET